MPNAPKLGFATIATPTKGVLIVLADEGLHLGAATREALEQHLDFARKLHIEAIVLQGQDVASSLVDFARRNRVTQAFLAKPPKRSIPLLTKMHMVMKVVRLAKDMQVTLVADRRRAGNP